LKKKSVLKNENFIFLIFLREKIITIILFIICVFIFWIIFFLYHIATSVALYPAILCGVVWLFYGMFQYFFYYKAHKKQLNLLNHIDVTFDNLPGSRTLLETDYQNLLKKLNEEKNKQIAQAEKKSRDMIEYISLWAHQIKTPITGMELILQNMEDRETASLKEKLFEINEYVDTSMQYIRMESLNSDLLIEEYPLISVIRQAVKYYSKIFIMKKISLDLQEMDTLVVTDEKWLVFVLKQILSNALKYTPAGKKISIYMDINFVKTLVIEDTGIGISAEDLPRIMERGFTGYNGRMDKKATGIGLYLTRQILDRLNHEITIESVSGQGTKVYINLSNLTKM